MDDIRDILELVEFTEEVENRLESNKLYTVLFSNGKLDTLYFRKYKTVCSKFEQQGRSSLRFSASSIKYIILKK